ncbi:MAG: GTP 3',8-cyclase MoaA [Rhodothermia bacterium]|nr:GTP 3',8-cyclase MoaA [Rhodothermia bacterium]
MAEHAHLIIVDSQSTHYPNRNTVTDILTDNFGRRHTYLRISLTERCNLRCTYCMPAEGVELSPREAILTFEEIERLATLFVEAGVRKIRLTGGEPLVRRDVEKLAERLAAIGPLESLAITTNGILLDRKGAALRDAGVDSLNISLDTFRPDRFFRITRRRGLERVLASIESALELGFDPVKVNCVVMRGINDDELTDFVAYTESMPVQVRFIEYMPFSGNGWNDAQFVSYSEMMIAIEDRYGPLTALQNGANDTTRSFKVAGWAGSIGFITSMSDHFCGTCNRLRLTADGNLKVCLFGAGEISLRDSMRTGATNSELKVLIDAAVKRKAAHHAGMYELADADDRPMILIGG